MVAVDLAIQIQFIAILVIDFCRAAPAIITAAATADNTTTFFILYALFVLFLTFRKKPARGTVQTISLTITVR